MGLHMVRLTKLHVQGRMQKLQGGLDACAGARRTEGIPPWTNTSSRTSMFVWFLFFFVTSGDGKEPQMGSRGQHPGRRVEDHVARVSSTVVRWENQRSQAAAANFSSSKP